MDNDEKLSLQDDILTRSDVESCSESVCDCLDCELTLDGYLVPMRAFMPDFATAEWASAEDFTIVSKDVSLTLLGVMRVRLDSSKSIDFKGLLSVEDDAISIFAGSFPYSIFFPSIRPQEARLTLISADWSVQC